MLHSWGMGHETRRPTHESPTADQTAAVRALVRRLGARQTQQALRLGRHTIDRILGGLTVHRGTIIALREALATVSVKEDPVSATPNVGDCGLSVESAMETHASQSEPP
jgi:hypothetical protein